MSFFEYLPRSGSVKSYGNSILKILRNLHIVSHSDGELIFKSSAVEMHLFIHSFTLILSTNITEDLPYVMTVRGPVEFINKTNLVLQKRPIK